MSATLRSANPHLVRRALSLSSPTFSRRTQLILRQKSSAATFLDNANGKIRQQNHKCNEKEFSTHAMNNTEHHHSDHNCGDLMSAFQLSQQGQVDILNGEAVATEISLRDAVFLSRETNNYDKIFLLLCNGDSHYADENDRQLSLTGKGIGQVLNTARLSATFCTKATGFTPDLFIVPPQFHLTQSALFAFPPFAPLGFSNVPWVCHPLSCEPEWLSKSRVNELESYFPGIDYEECMKHQRNEERIQVGLDKMDGAMELLMQTNEFLSWLLKREERIIVITSDSSWLQSFCGFTLNCQAGDNGLRKFKEGELRAVALKF